MELLASLASGFETALRPDALLFCFVGVSVGTLVGLLPGIGPIAAISMALPLTFYLDPTIALIMLAGIFYGAQYGGSIASILLNIPGDAPAAVTCLDGYPLTRQGKAGLALFVSAVSSFLGGSFAILVLIGLAPTVAAIALKFGPVEYFSIMLLGLVAGSTLSVGSPVKGIAMVMVGIALGISGIDVDTGRARFTFDLQVLRDGVNLVSLAMGLFGVAEILNNVGKKASYTVTAKSVSVRSMIPTFEEMRRVWLPTLRGAVIGSIAGALPGTGPTIASFMAYATEKRTAQDPSRFGHGAIEGVAAPEAANNAAVQAGFIPTLSLGIPGDSIMAVILGALMIHGIAPGPQFIAENPDMFWGLVASFWVGNVMLLILNIPLIGVWVRILAVPYYLLYPSMLLFICVGVYSINNNMFDIYLVLLFGVVGYFMLQFGYPAAPLLLGFILGPLMEEYLRRALLISDGDFIVFVLHPISAGALLVAVAVLLIPLRTYLRGARRPQPETF